MLTWWGIMLVVVDTEAGYYAYVVRHYAPPLYGVSTTSSIFVSSKVKTTLRDLGTGMSLSCEGNWKLGGEGLENFIDKIMMVLSLTKDLLSKSVFCTKMTLRLATYPYDVDSNEHFDWVITWQLVKCSLEIFLIESFR